MRNKWMGALTSCVSQIIDCLKDLLNVLRFEPSSTELWHFVSHFALCWNYFVHCLLMMIVSFKWTLFKVRVGLCLNLCRLLVFCRLFKSIQSNVSSALSLCLNLLHIVFSSLYCLNDMHIVQRHSRKDVLLISMIVVRQRVKLARTWGIWFT